MRLADRSGFAVFDWDVCAAVGEKADSAAETEVKVSNHTRGPWRVVDELILSGGSGRTGMVIAKNHDLIHYECEEENMANARLISAAPELLNACKTALGLEDTCDECEGPRFEVIRNAINRAEGK